MEFAGEEEHFAQVAVDPEADARLGLLRLDVDVGRPLAQGEIDHLVEHADQRLVLGQRRQAFAGDVGLPENIVLRQLGEAVDHGLFRAVLDGNGIRDLAGQAEDGAEGDLGNLLDATHQGGVLGLAHGDGQDPVDDIEANGLGLQRDLRRDFVDRLIGDGGG